MTDGKGLGMNEWETCIDEWATRCRELQATVEALQRERDHAKKMEAVQKEVADNQTWHVRELRAALDAEREKVKGQTQRAEYAEGKVRELLLKQDALELKLSQLQALVREIKKEFDNCTHECERCGESDPLTTFDIYRTVAKAATLDATTPARGQE